MADNRGIGASNQESASLSRGGQRRSLLTKVKVDLSRDRPAGESGGGEEVHTTSTYLPTDYFKSTTGETLTTQRRSQLKP